MFAPVRRLHRYSGLNWTRTPVPVFRDLWPEAADFRCSRKAATRPSVTFRIFPSPIQIVKEPVLRLSRELLRYYAIGAGVGERFFGDALGKGAAMLPVRSGNRKAPTTLREAGAPEKLGRLAYLSSSNMFTAFSPVAERRILSPSISATSPIGR